MDRRLGEVEVRLDRIDHNFGTYENHLKNIIHREEVRYVVY